MVKTKVATKSVTKPGKTQSRSVTTTTTTVTQIATVFTAEGTRTAKVIRQQKGKDEKVDGKSVKRTQQSMTKKMTHVERRIAGALQDKKAPAPKKKPMLALKNHDAPLALENRRAPLPMRAQRVKLSVKAPNGNSAASAVKRSAMKAAPKKRAAASSHNEDPLQRQTRRPKAPAQRKRQEPQAQRNVQEPASPSSQETVRHHYAKEEAPVAVKRERQRRAVDDDDDIMFVAGSYLKGEPFFGATVKSERTKQENISQVKVAKEEPFNMVKENHRHTKEERHGAGMHYTKEETNDVRHYGQYKVKGERNQFSAPSSQSSMIMLD